MTRSPAEDLGLESRVAALERTVAELRDQEAIRSVYLRYMWGFDRRNAEISGSAFWPDAEINYADTTSTPAEFFETHFAGHNALTSNSRHLIYPHHVDIEGDVAHVDAYVTEFSTLRDGRSRIVGGRYVDRLDRRDGEWRIAVREFMPQFFTETDNNRDSNTGIRDLYARYDDSPYGAGALDETDVAFVRPLPRRFSTEADA